MNRISTGLRQGATITQLTNADREAIQAAIASRRAEEELSRRVRQNLIEVRQRRLREDRPDQERLARGLLAAAGMDLADLKRRRQKSIEQSRAVRDAQRGLINEHSHAVAERQRFNPGTRVHALRAAQRLAATPYTLTTLHTAAQILHGPLITPPPGRYVDVTVDPLSPMHNVARALIGWDSTPDIQFHVRGLWDVDLYWVFPFRATSDVLLNASTFVQPQGAYYLFTEGWFLGDSTAEVDLTARLDLWVAGRRLDPGAFDPALDRSLHSDWWDLSATSDANIYNDESALFDNNFTHVPAGTTVYIIVAVRLQVDADGLASSELDFATGNFQINVPAVYVSTFPAPPIT